MPIHPVQVKSILQQSHLPDASYVINPYIGCVHGCVYCYARFMKRFTNHPEEWGAFLDAKVNAPAVLEDQLAHRRAPLNEPVFFSSVTDPYQPPEAQQRLTRDLLEVLLRYQAPISILTKSDLVLRDIDLFKQFRHCTVGMSLMTVDDDLARRFEPRATPPSRRLAALAALHAAGIHTYAFVSPFLPGLSDIEQIGAALAGSIDELGVEALNPRSGNWRGVEAVLAEHYPDALADCRRLVADDGYWRGLGAQVGQVAKNLGVKPMGFYRH